MRKALYMRLAAGNLKKNRQLYGPYLIACIVTVMMMCIMILLEGDRGLNTIEGGQSVAATLMFGCIVIAIFSLIILVYINSLLIKQRKKEFALYNVLGMEKRHISKVLFWESAYTAVISIGAGLIFGAVFSKLMQLILMKIIGGEISFSIDVSFSVLVFTAAIFAVFFLLVLLMNIRTIRIAQPVELLRGGSEGEREPKSKWVLAVLGVVFLAAGYVMSIMTKDVVSAITLFFIAVICVIIGTYLMFIAFSIVLLKGLKKNKRYYYQTKHFATVSGMIYRMKRNAAGLASICILSTMVIVTVSTTVCLYAGIGDIIKQAYPYDVNVKYYPYSQQTSDTLSADARDIAQQQGVEIKELYAFSKLSFMANRKGDTLSIDKDTADGRITNDGFVDVTVITPADYKRITGEDAGLKKGEALIYSENGGFGDKVEILGEEYKASEIKEFPEATLSSSAASRCGIVADSSEAVEAISRRYEKLMDCESYINGGMYINLDGTDDEKIAFTGELNDRIQDNTGEKLNYEFMSAESRQLIEKDGSYSFYGAFFFLGMFLGLVFIFATVMIIYYKQVSEGYDDRKRFDIMQKVGMTEAEVKQTIRSQVLIVFFLPLAAAAMHVAFAFPMIRRILAAFSMTNVTLFAVCTAATFIGFAVIYLLVYLQTSKTYYSIVRR
ncbi:MAG: ABC transporter permease [Clostridiales bacterium]|nr:ABC transporter permease [Clostridiales bacterium]